MAFETELGNVITIGNAVSAAMSKPFVNASQGLALVYKEVCPENTNVIKFPKSGNLVAEALAQSTDYSYSANSELTDTSATATATKKVAGAKLTVEADRFGKPGARIQRLASEGGLALGRLFDADLKALFSSIAGGVTASSTLTKDNLLDARYTIVNGVKGAFSGKLVGMFDYKGVNEIAKELTSITASAFGNMEMLGVIGLPQSNGYMGSFLGIDIYQTDGLPSSGGDDVACVWDPTMCFAAAIDGAGGFYNSLKDPSAINGVSTELLMWTFWNIVEWNDAAGCRVLSDT